MIVKWKQKITKLHHMSKGRGYYNSGQDLIILLSYLQNLIILFYILYRTRQRTVVLLVC